MPTFWQDLFALDIYSGVVQISLSLADFSTDGVGWTPLWQQHSMSLKSISISLQLWTSILQKSFPRKAFLGKVEMAKWVGGWVGRSATSNNNQPQLTLARQAAGDRIH